MATARPSMTHRRASLISSYVRKDEIGVVEQSLARGLVVWSLAKIIGNETLTIVDQSQNDMGGIRVDGCGPFAVEGESVAWKQPQSIRYALRVRRMVCRH